MPNTALMPPVVINGVNVTALQETLGAVKQGTDIADYRLRAKTPWLAGNHNRTVIEGFFGACEPHAHDKGPIVMDNAMPPVLLGAGAAPNPVEYVLHALAGCLTTTLVYHAAAQGIEVAEVDSEIEGELDLRGFLGLSNDVRKGFHVVRVNMRAKSKADPVTLDALAKYSPVYDVVSKSLPVEVTMETR